MASFVAILALASAAPSLSNGFSYDDVPVVAENPRVHSLAPPTEYLGQSYWPPDRGGALHRPAAIQFFALQWALGGGHAAVFHATSVLVYILCALAVYALAYTILPPAAAFGAAALFAVHPVHVEAVGGIVGQAELLCTLATVIAVTLYVRARRRHGMSPRTRLALMVLALLAALSKEQGFVLPALLLFAEALVVPAAAWDRVRGRAVLGALGPVLAMLAAVFALRLAVLGGMGGGAPAFGLRDTGVGTRVLTALALVPEWLRLLMVPTHLRVEYSPPEFTASTGFGLREFAGLALLVGLVVFAVRLRRRYPAIALGLGWVAIGLAPVSNVLFLTGVIIAERTLFLPSVGIVLAAGGTWLWLRDSLPDLIPRWVGGTVLVALVILGMARSIPRQRIWRDSPALHAQSVLDSPRGYRSHLMYGVVLRAQDSLGRAEDQLKRAASLYGGDYRVYEELTQVVRQQRSCADAIGYMKQALALDSTLTLSRSRLFYCYLGQGEVATARDVAAEGERLGLTEFTPLRLKADSLLGALDQ